MECDAEPPSWPSLSSGVSGHSTTGCTDNHSPSSPVSSPETRRHTSGRKSSFLKELGAIGHEIRRAGVSLRSSMESLVSNCSRSTPELHKERRRIRIEVISEKSTGNARRRGATTEAYEDGEDWTYEYSDHNFSSTMTLMSLQNGLFSAQVPLERIPYGNIVIRICDYRLEIVLDKRELQPDRRLEDSHRVTQPLLVGSIDVPIYVDTSTLHFQLDPELDILRIDGSMKGYVNRKLSASAGDIRSLIASHNFRRRRLKSKSQAHSVVSVCGGLLDDNTMAKEVSRNRAASHDWIDRFRSRAYTH